MSRRVGNALLGVSAAGTFMMESGLRMTSVMLPSMVNHGMWITDGDNRDSNRVVGEDRAICKSP
jgi:hypothetical protein